MKTAPFTLCLLLLTCSLHSETFLGVTSATNRFVIGTNESVFITNFRVNGAGPIQIVKDGQVFSFPNGFSAEPTYPLAVAGPCEFIFTNSALVNFRRYSSSSFESIVLLPQANTNAEFTVSVPTGRNIRVFRPIGHVSSGYAILRRGTNAWSIDNSFGADEFSGPLEVAFRGPKSPEDGQSPLPVLHTYGLSESAVVVPQGLAIQGPTGAFQIAVEKSVNFTNWSPAILQDIRDDQKAFYRLRIAK
jgi:hypothetical protein